MHGREIFTKTKEFLILTLPYAGTNVLTSVSEQVEIYILGNASQDILAAAGLTSIAFPVTVIFNSPLLALTSIISELHGEGDKRSIETAMHQGWLYGSLMSVPQAAFMLSGKPILRLLGQPDNLVNMTGPYFFINTLSILPASWLYSSMAYPQGTGKKLPIFAFNLFNLIGKSILNYGLIINAGLGLEGLAISRVVQSWLNIIAFTGYLKIVGAKEEYNFFQFKCLNFKSLAKRFVKMAFFMGIEMAVIQGSVIFKRSLVGTFGVNSINAIQVIEAYRGFPLLICDAISQALCISIGQHVGKKEYRSIRDLNIIGVLSGLAVTSLAAVPCFLFPEVITDFFVSGMDHEGNELAKKLFYISALQMISDGINNIITGAFWGLEDSFTSARLTTLIFLFITLPLTLGLYFGTNLDAVGVSIGFLIGSIVDTVAVSIAWQKKSGKLLLLQDNVNADPNTNTNTNTDNNPALDTNRNWLPATNFLHKFSFLRSRKKKEEYEMVADAMVAESEHKEDDHVLTANSKVIN